MTNVTERAPRIAVVGVCGSGKTTIVNHLRQRGYDAYVVSQEHSIIRNLWNRRKPDVLVVLEARLETVRARRNEEWPGWIYDLQRDRLSDARAHATVLIETDARSIEETVELITQALKPDR